MTSTATFGLVSGAFTSLGTAMLTILGLVLGIGVAYLVFKFGWRKVKGSVR